MYRENTRAWSTRFTNIVHFQLYMD